MGRLFLADLIGARGFARRVVIKVVADKTEEQLERLLVQEARLTSQLAHQNIVAVLDLEESDGQQLMVLEYVDGLDVRKLLEVHGALPWEMAAFIACEVLAGLDYAHRRADPAGRPLHIVHRDVSTGNILLSWDGEVRLTDFGVAKAARRWSSGGLKGNIAYMAPEQAVGEPIDARADLYSLGIVLQEMLTGKNPFGHRNDLQTLAQVVDVPVPRLEVASAPRALIELVTQATARSAADRPASAALFRRALLDLPGLPSDPSARLTELIAPFKSTMRISAATLSDEGDVPRRTRAGSRGAVSVHGAMSGWLRILALLAAVLGLAGIAWKTLRR
jgi:serine/threonine-protein kinase